MKRVAQNPRGYLNKKLSDFTFCSTAQGTFSKVVASDFSLQV